LAYPAKRNMEWHYKTQKTLTEEKIEAKGSRE
jgi:hypothetical protein